MNYYTPEVSSGYLIGWVCPLCGRGNSPFNSICSCKPFQAYPTYQPTYYPYYWTSSSDTSK